MKIKEIEQLLLGIEEVAQELIEEFSKDDRVGVQKLIQRYYSIKQKEEELRKVFYEKMKYENDLRQQGIRYIAGIDEVGRGPLAGPVVSAAVVLPEDFYLPGLTDSKKLSKEKRDYFYEIIKREALAYRVTYISVEVIDQINIYEATKSAMLTAITGLKIKPQHLLIDAMKLETDIPQTSIIKGDDNSITIAASSVIAKVERDRYMEELGRKYPQYGFERHMGYGTKEHLEALELYGPINEHRRTFSPVREILEANS